MKWIVLAGLLALIPTVTDLIVDWQFDQHQVQEFRP